MLKSIRLENFKLHEKTTIDAARITVFIGPNNSGKSSIFQALLALRQALSRGRDTFLQAAQRQPTDASQPLLYPMGETVDLGDFAHVVRRGKAQIAIGASGTIRSETILGYDSNAEVSFDVHIRENKLAYHRGSIKTAYGEAPWQHGLNLPAQPNLTINVEGFQIVLGAASDFRLLLLRGQLSQSPAAASPARLLDVTEFANYLASCPRLLLDSLHAVAPLRGFEEWAYPTAVQFPKRVDLLVLEDRGVALANTLASNRQLKAELSGRLEQLVQIGIDFEVVGGNRLRIWAQPTTKQRMDTLFVNEGTGPNQLPFILIPVVLASEGETILLSEPEAHLHPKAQSELTALLLKVAEKQNLQVFIETHSEHVLHKVLHAVAKGELARDDLAIYYFENKEGTAKVSPLKVDERGGVEGGLPGFYDQSLTELSDYLDALKKT